MILFQSVVQGAAPRIMEGAYLQWSDWFGKTDGISNESFAGNQEVPDTSIECWASSKRVGVSLFELVWGFGGSVPENFHIFGPI